MTLNLFHPNSNPKVPCTKSSTQAPIRTPHIVQPRRPQPTIMATSPFQSLLRIPPSIRLALFPRSRPHFRRYTHLALPHPHTRSLSLPRVLQPSFWSSMIPKPFKSRTSTTTSEWNPATPYIILGLLVGSQAIQILWLKQDRGHALRKAEAKIGLLKEVIERVQSGEKVDVEGVLGTGREGEGEWAEGTSRLF